MLRVYARLTGAALALLGMAGLLGIWDAMYGDIVLYFFTAAVFLYVGFRRWTSRELRGVVGGMGLVLLLIGGSIVGIQFVLGLPFEDTFVKDNFVRIGLGLLSILCAILLPCKDDPTPPASS